ncbi:hypothetical protein Ddye_012252 [Dipteronia dyeriana]|uniref:Reverse transcriptase domain-containing protein n=1 Tax=Dipteronia dyeriana TaxID=168575 RepID=A0AAD9X403_9ROSI|nr:hypothetical protein Ddye_012252 [Dipteronia dyeriana]
MKRGLHQGDPLSPFLFNIAVEVLNCLFLKPSDSNLLKGVKFGLDGVHVTQLQFTDDTIIFIEPKLEYLLNVKRTLRYFELASGLRINFHKSCIVQVGKKGHSETD